VVVVELVMVFWGVVFLTLGWHDRCRDMVAPAAVWFCVTGAR